MFFKVIKNNRVIDVLDLLTYVKYQQKHNIMLLCPENEAEAIVSSDGKYYWRTQDFPSNKYKNIDTVELIEIDKYEYQHLKILNGKTIEEILDEYTLSLMESGVL